MLPYTALIKRLCTTLCTSCQLKPRIPLTARAEQCVIGALDAQIQAQPALSSAGIDDAVTVGGMCAYQTVVHLGVVQLPGLGQLALTPNRGTDAPQMRQR